MSSSKTSMSDTFWRSCRDLQAERAEWEHGEKPIDQVVHSGKVVPMVFSSAARSREELVPALNCPWSSTMDGSHQPIHLFPTAIRRHVPAGKW